MHPDLTAFINAKTAAGLSVNSLTWYSKSISWYLDWVSTQSLDAQQPETVEGFLTHLRIRKLSAFTISGCYRVLSVYFKWLVRRGKLGVSPMPLIQSPKLPKQRKRHVTAAQFATLYNSITGTTWRDYRDRSIFQILFYSGLRAGELVNLKGKSIDRDQQLILVTSGKGDKDRDVPYLPSMLVQLDSYLSLSPPHDWDSLFVAAAAKSATLLRGPLTFNGLTMVMRRRCKAAGLPRLGLHSFRHGFAMLFLNSGGMELDAISKSMGHSTSAITRKYYADYDTTALRRQYNDALQRIDYPD